MGIKMKTPPSSFDKFGLECKKILSEELIRAFSMLGERCVRMVKDRSQEESWIDRTGNLRNSIGDVVLNHGQKVIESVLGQISDSGNNNSQNIINEAQEKYKNIYALIVFAGMNYAEYVERHDNKDVLGSTLLWVRSIIDKYMNGAKERALKRINALKL